MPDIKNKDDNPPSDDSKKTEKESQKAFDPKNLGDEDFSKIFEDPRLYQHSRFKELTEAKSELKKLRDAEEARKEKELEDQKKWKELADKAKTERDEAIGKLKAKEVDNLLTIEASKAGVRDLDVVLKVVDRSKITTDENGEVKGVDEAIKTLIESKPYLKGEQSTPDLGVPTNPTGDNQVKKFTLSQIQNPEFYQEHRDEIALASRTPGGIIDDVNSK